MKALAKVLALGAAGVTGAAALGWLGTRVPARPFAPITGTDRDLGTVPIPETLPAPVRRYLEAAAGPQLSRAETFVVWGRARVRLGLWMHARFRAYHVAGRHFHRPLEITWFGRPLVRGVDQYVDGRGAMLIAGQLMTNDAISQGANHMLWAEAPCVPAVFVTDERIRWEPVDDHSARLVVPSIEGEDTLTLRFDPDTGLISRLSAMRYKTADEPKVLWHVDYPRWDRSPTGILPGEVAVTWEDEGTPWSYWTIEGCAVNIDVAPQMEAARAIMHRAAPT